MYLIRHERQQFCLLFWIWEDIAADTSKFYFASHKYGGVRLHLGTDENSPKYVDEIGAALDDVTRTVPGKMKSTLKDHPDGSQRMISIYPILKFKGEFQLKNHDSFNDFHVIIMGYGFSTIIK